MNEVKISRRGVSLSEDQWRLLKSHAARRGQTISEFFSDVVGELGMDGHVRSATKAQIVDPSVEVTSGPTRKTTGEFPKPATGPFAEFRPAPKPEKKK